MLDPMRHLAWLFLLCASTSGACASAAPPAVAPAPAIEPAEQMPLDEALVKDEVGEEQEDESNARVTESGLGIEDLVEGDGDEAVDGKEVSVHYVGHLPDGTEFDSSYKRAQAFEFIVGGGAVIKGWDEGLVGMRVGGKRRLTIPPALAYGSKQVGPIPPDSVLEFDIELLDVR
jgi:FKBP-type peptidyl-prolyl cis-trans isomerase